MDQSQRIITDNDTLRRLYHELAAGDVFIGRVRLKPTEDHLLLDLVERGVTLFPSATAQRASRSKTFQALLFAPHMVPHTLVIHDQHDLLEAVNLYGRQRIERVVTKHDRRNAGMGIHLWPSIEEAYGLASFGTIPYPFVVQPFVDRCRDIRVIVLGDYTEAYRRHNPDNFRNNLHCGGHGEPCELTPEQRKLCETIMARGSFPYAHVDLMVTADNRSYLAEINLRGGLRGARIDAVAYRERVEAIHQAALSGYRGR